MNKQGDTVKTLLLRGVKAFGQTASNIATNAQTKLNQINLEARRREIITEIPNLAMKLWIDGVSLPTELTDLLGELTEVDDKLMKLQAQKYSQINEEQSEKVLVTEAQAVDTCKTADNPVLPNDDSEEAPIDSNGEK